MCCCKASPRQHPSDSEAKDHRGCVASCVFDGQLESEAGFIDKVSNYRLCDFQLAELSRTIIGTEAYKANVEPRMIWVNLIRITPMELSITSSLCESLDRFVDLHLCADLDVIRQVRNSLKPRARVRTESMPVELLRAFPSGHPGPTI